MCQYNFKSYIRDSGEEENIAVNYPEIVKEMDPLKKVSYKN